MSLFYLFPDIFNSLNLKTTNILIFKVNDASKKEARKLGPKVPTQAFWF